MVITGRISFKTLEDKLSGPQLFFGFIFPAVSNNNCGVTCLKIKSLTILSPKNSLKCLLVVKTLLANSLPIEEKKSLKPFAISPEPLILLLPTLKESGMSILDLLVPIASLTVSHVLFILVENSLNLLAKYFLLATLKILLYNELNILKAETLSSVGLRSFLAPNFSLCFLDLNNPEVIQGLKGQTILLVLMSITGNANS